MILELQGYDYEIKYRPGKEITLADGLSRLPNERNNKQIKLDVKVQLVQFSSSKIDQLRQESNKDQEILMLRSIITGGWPENQRDVPKEMRKFWPYRDELSVEGPLVMKGTRVFIPPSMKKEIIVRLHGAHQGVEKCMLRA